MSQMPWGPLSVLFGQPDREPAGNGLKLALLLFLCAVLVAVGVTVILMVYAQ